MACGYGKFQDVVGSNPDTGYWMDIFQIFLQKLQCLLDKTEYKNDKRGRWLPILKIIYLQVLSAQSFSILKALQRAGTTISPTDQKCVKSYFFIK